MKKLIANPFKFGNPVEGDYYLSRPELSATLKQFLENRIHIVLIGPRRFGKTSFSLNLLEEFEKKGWSCLYVDIFNITSHRDFLQQLVRAFRGKKSFSRSLKSWWQKVKRFTPKISVEMDSITGNPSLNFALAQLPAEDRTSLSLLTASGANLEGTVGLSVANRKLLKQHGASANHQEGEREEEKNQESR